MRERRRLIIVAKRESRIVLFRAFSVKANKKASQWMMDGKRDGELELEPEPGPGPSTSALAGRCHPILRSGSSLSAVNQVESSSPLDKWKAGCKSSPPFPHPRQHSPTAGKKDNRPAGLYFANQRFPFSSEMVQSFKISQQRAENLTSADMDDDVDWQPS